MLRSSTLPYDSSWSFRYKLCSRIHSCRSRQGLFLPKNLTRTSFIQRRARVHLGTGQTKSVHEPPMGRVLGPPSRESHRTRCGRRPDRHRMVFCRRVDERRHLDGETEAESCFLGHRRVYCDTPYSVGLFCDLEEVEEERRRADQATPG